ncbi:MAG: hypothetical protein ACPHQP_06940 [Longimicrobiales bacterium]
MSNEVTSGIPPAAPQLSWPPPGTERLQGTLWRGIGLSWVGSLILVLPLLWALAVEQPFYSLGPFEENWELGMAIAGVGAILLLFAFAQLWMTARGGAAAAELGYGILTILEVATDVGRDTGFLIQGKRHFAFVDEARQKGIIRSRLLGGLLLLAAAAWLLVGFGLVIFLAARGFVTPSGIWLLTVAPTVVLLALGAFVTFRQGSLVLGLQSDWNAQEGMSRVHTESAAWNARLDAATPSRSVRANGAEPPRSGPRQPGSSHSSGSASAPRPPSRSPLRSCASPVSGSSSILRRAACSVRVARISTASCPAS